MKDLSKESYLKDKGSSYRYTQAYKLQLNVLQQLAPLIIHLDLADNQIELAMDTIQLYLNNKQPVPLQVNQKNHQSYVIFIFFLFISGSNAEFL